MTGKRTRPLTEIQSQRKEHRTSALYDLASAAVGLIEEQKIDNAQAQAQPELKAAQEEAAPQVTRQQLELLNYYHWHQWRSVLGTNMALSELLTSQQAECKRLQEQLSLATQKISELEAKNLEQQSSIDRETKSNNALRETLTITQRSHSISYSLSTKNRKTIEELTATKQRLELTAQKIQQENSALLAKLSTTENSLYTLKSLYDQSQSSTGQLMAEIIDLRKQVDNNDRPSLQLFHEENRELQLQLAEAKAATSPSPLPPAEFRSLSTPASPSASSRSPLLMHSLLSGPAALESNLPPDTASKKPDVEDDDVARYLL